MITRYFVLVMVIVLVACTGATVSPEPILPESTASPEPTVIPTKEISTEIPPTPTPAPTDTPEATPTQVPTGIPIPIQFNFDWYEDNPILNKGVSGEWDNLKLVEGKAVYYEDIFHIFFTGIGDELKAIGYASSTDGIEFTKHDLNPIFQSDSEGFDAVGAVNGTPLVVDGTWMLFYAGIAPGEIYHSQTGGGSSIGLATATKPTGPWTSGEQVLTIGKYGEWDSGFIFPSSVIITDEGYYMYYTAGMDKEVFESMCGLATSPDGINWTKYNDPKTDEPPFIDSDPVIQPGSSGWDSGGIDCSVIKTDTDWEMIYEGWDGEDRIGFAHSEDGINWTKYKLNPMIGSYRFYPSAIKVGSTYYLYAQTNQNLCVATGTIDRP